jgi:hypothetical protein
MKAIVLISSIFYILGLKISNKIDIIKKDTTVLQNAPVSASPQIQQKAINFNEAASQLSATDSTAIGGMSHQNIQEYR